MFATFLVLVGVATGAAAASPTVYSGLSTTASSFGSPYSGCGVPPALLKDDLGKPLPYVVLNTFAPNGKTPGDFANGANCGRWIQFFAGNPCTHGSDQPQNPPGKVCIYNGTYGPSNYDTVGDAITAAHKVTYGYIANSCADNNYWCRQDAHHLGISLPYLQSVYGPAANWLNRKVTWEFLAGIPAGWKMLSIKFEWAINASQYWRTVVVYNLPNGIAGIKLKMANGAFVSGTKVLGQQWTLPNGAVYKGVYTVQVLQFGGAPYPGVYTLSPPPAKAG